MENKKPLNSTERKQEWLLLIVGIVTITLLIIAVIFQYIELQYESILTPICCLSMGIWFSIYAYIALTSKFIMQKWTPFDCYNILLLLCKKISKKDYETSQFITSIIISVISILLAISCFIISYQLFFK